MADKSHSSLLRSRCPADVHRYPVADRHAMGTGRAGMRVDKSKCGPTATGGVYSDASQATNVNVSRRPVWQLGGRPSQPSNDLGCSALRRDGKSLSKVRRSGECRLEMPANPANVGLRTPNKTGNGGTRGVFWAAWPSLSYLMDCGC